MRARSARRLSVLPARTQLSSVDRSSGVKVRRVGYLLIPHHGIYRLSLQLSTRGDGVAAVATASAAAPDVVLTDVTLAGNMRGTEAAATIWQRLQIPVIFPPHMPKREHWKRRNRQRRSATWRSLTTPNRSMPPSTWLLRIVGKNTPAEYLSRQRGSLRG